MFHATVTQLENCASWNMQEAEAAERNASSPKTLEKDRGYWKRRAERLDMQAFRLFRQAHDARSTKLAA